MKRRALSLVGVLLVLLMAIPAHGLAADPRRIERVPTRGRATPGLAEALAATRGSRRIEVAVQVRGRTVGARVGERALAGEPLSDAGVASARRQVRSAQRATRSRLRSLGARIQKTYTDVFNGFRVRVRADRVRRISRLPGVTAVLLVPRHVPDNSRTDRYIGVPAAWGATDRTGRGVTIAIIDSGINYYHQDFGGAGNTAWRDDDPTVREPGTFPTAKVVGGTDLVGDDYDADTNDVPRPDDDPLDCKASGSDIDQHGTHVAGTAAGMGVTSAGTYRGSYDAGTLERTDFRIAPGVAPRARLLAFRVFGCRGGTYLVVDAIERAVRAGADVINLSLGSSFGDPGSLDALAVDNAALAGVTVVVSSGNSGSSAYMTGSPGVATRAISVAAMDALSSFKAARIDMATGSDITAIVANGATADVRGRLVRFRDDPDTDPDPVTGAGLESLGCHVADYEFNGAREGDIVAVDRGICPRADRAVLGQRQGAAAVIMINDADALPPFEGPIRGARIPFLGVRSGIARRFATDDGRTIRVRPRSALSNPAFRSVAAFSSAGPRSGDSALKPDVTAPGVSVMSADGATTNAVKGMSGTSMAAPAVAGVAALVLEAHPDFSPRDVKAAIVGTATTTGLSGFDMRRAGSGLVQPRRAIETVALAYTEPGASSLSFGARNAMARAGTSVAFRATLDMTIRNRSSRAIRYDLRNSFAGTSRDLRVAISPRSVSVPARSTRRVSVTVSMAEGDVAGLPDADGSLGTDADGQPFATLATVRGTIIATPRSSGRGIHPLRVPWMVVPRGLSDVRPGSRTSWSTDGDLRRSRLRVTNHGLHRSYMDIYAWGLSDAREGYGGVDLRAAGVQSVPAWECTGIDDPDDRCLLFAINTWGPWSNAAATEWAISIDSDLDGTEDRLILGIDDGLVFSGFENGVLDALVIDTETGELLGEPFYAVAPARGSTLLLVAMAKDLGLSPGDPSFGYQVSAVSLFGDEALSDVMDNTSNSNGASERARYNAFRPVVRNGAFELLGGGRRFDLPLVVDAERLDPDRGDRGWLVVALDDANGAAQADTVPVGAVP
ncbi:MAG: S8 family serine peptidase [Candidatus Limnocylindrales bacterium]